MKRRYLLSVPLLALLAVPGLAAADEQPRERPTLPAGEYQDFVYLGEQRPVVVRLHVQVDGKPFETAWAKYIQAAFAWYDRNGDGTLSEEEAAPVPGPQALGQLFRFNGIVPQNGPKARFGDLDADSDGRVTLEEFANYYRRSGAGPIQISQPPTQGLVQNALTDVLFKYLDTNKDGKLSKEELAAAPALLARLDANGDEVIDAGELQSGGGAARLLFSPPLQRGQPGMVPGNFFVVVPDGSPKRFNPRMQLAQKVLKQYDKDGNGKLSREEVRFDKATFARLDRNNDGELDQTDLLRLLNPPYDLEITLRLGKLDGRQLAAELVQPDGKPSPLAKSSRLSSNGMVTLGVGAAQVEVRRLEGQAFNNVAATRQFYINQFQMLNKDNRGFVERKQLESPQQRALLPIFDPADRDGDGRLTLKELEDYFDLQAKSVGSFITVAVADQGQGLFGLLDANGDGRLGLRELRTAWTRLAAYDKDGDGCVSRTEVPRQFQVLVSRGLPNFFGRGGIVQPGLGQQQAAPVTTVGPLWFRKMDRNGDGDISPAEWLGTPEDFKRIDLDGDGLISADEAEKADAARRGKKPGKE